MEKNNLKEKDLIALSVESEGSILSKDGALVVLTGKYTGRAPNAKKIEIDEKTKHAVDWSSNSDILPTVFDERLKKYLAFSQMGDFYSQDVSAVRDERHSLGLRIHTQFAKHSLFVRNMFVPDRAQSFDPQVDWELFHFPVISEEPEVLISFSKRKILISGTYYSGEIKKSVFTVLNYIFPEKGFLPMHCSVNVDQNRKNPAIFFGLSGTGKTTLSSDQARILIGDDEHAWTHTGLTNFEGGCYAKTISLSRSDEPQIWDACHKPGAMLENVVLNDGYPDFDDATHTENTRASYSTKLISGSDPAGWVDVHPSNIIMLTCDAFGILPPVMKLSPEEAVEQFLLGYTAKVAGTEKGITEPVATFSPCFGAPFMPLPPSVYGEILKRKIEYHKVDCWFVNTGWTGGPYGDGSRMPIKITRNIINAILDGTLSQSNTFVHEYTGFTVPEVHGSLISYKMLKPELGWKSLEEYEVAVEKFNIMREVAHGK